MKQFSFIYLVGDLVCQPFSLLNPNRSLGVPRFRHVLMHAIRVRAAIERRSFDECLKLGKGKIDAYSHDTSEMMIQTSMNTHVAYACFCLH